MRNCILQCPVFYTMVNWAQASVSAATASTRGKLGGTSTEKHTCEAGILVVAVVPAGEVDS